MPVKGFILQQKAHLFVLESSERTWIANIRICSLFWSQSLIWKLEKIVLIIYFYLWFLQIISLKKNLKIKGEAPKFRFFGETLKKTFSKILLVDLNFFLFSECMNLCNLKNYIFTFRSLLDLWESSKKVKNRPTLMHMHHL